MFAGRTLKASYDLEHNKRQTLWWMFVVASLLTATLVPVVFLLLIESVYSASTIYVIARWYESLILQNESFGM